MTYDLFNIVFIIIAVYSGCTGCIPAVYWGCNDHVFIPCSLFSYVKKFVLHHMTFDLINVVFDLVNFTFAIIKLTFDSIKLN